MLKTIEKYKEGFFAMINQGDKDYNPFVEISRLKLSGETWRLMMFYIGVVQYDNRIKAYTQREIAEMTDMAQPNVSNANKALLEAGIIIKDGRDYYFSDKFVKKGLKRYKIKK